MATGFQIGAVHRDLPFVVDTWGPDGLDKPQFLTHPHKDHTVGIEQYGTQIWCTDVTRQLLLIRTPDLVQKGTTFEVLEVHDGNDEDVPSRQVRLSKILRIA